VLEFSQIIQKKFSLEVEALRAEVAERNSQLKWLQERIAETESQKQEASTAISDANRLVHIHKNSTRSEVFRLKG
jgi:kinetochore protein Spc7/SPC105